MTEMKVDINTASLEALVSIKGIGESLAKRIIDNRPYDTVDGLVKVSGINEAKLAHLEPLITIEKETAVVPAPVKLPPISQESAQPQPVTKIGDTEAFVFLEDKNDRQDALLIIFGGFILGLIILLLRRSE